jgi:plasmid stabilization system protein ParE
VAGFRLTHRAEDDLAEIGAYTLRTWGAEQCARYLDQLEACCKRLAEIRGAAALAVAHRCVAY